MKDVSVAFKKKAVQLFDAELAFCRLKFLEKFSCVITLKENRGVALVQAEFHVVLGEVVYNSLFFVHELAAKAAHVFGQLPFGAVVQDSTGNAWIFDVLSQHGCLVWCAC